MTEQNAITLLLRNDAERLAGPPQQTKPDIGKQVDARLSRRLKRIQHLRNFTITTIAVLAVIAFAFFFTQEHRSSSSAAVICALGAFGFIALFSFIHDPDY